MHDHGLMLSLLSGMQLCMMLVCDSTATGVPLPTQYMHLAMPSAIRQGL